MDEKVVSRSHYDDVTHTNDTDSEGNSTNPQPSALSVSTS